MLIANFKIDENIRKKIQLWYLNKFFYLLLVIRYFNFTEKITHTYYTLWNESMSIEYDDYL